MTTHAQEDDARKIVHSTSFDSLSESTRQRRAQAKPATSRRSACDVTSPSPLPPPSLLLSASLGLRGSRQSEHKRPSSVSSLVSWRRTGASRHSLLARRSAARLFRLLAVLAAVREASLAARRLAEHHRARAAEHDRLRVREHRRAVGRSDKRRAMGQYAGLNERMTGAQEEEQAENSHVEAARALHVHEVRVRALYQAAKLVLGGFLRGRWVEKVTWLKTQQRQER